ncbi:MAG TPA: hypothetical protein VFV59_10035 [Candidatus Limnocylindria bacterium]|jgi:hypothetical protein|nr:hypothetical protein [Candidatus Limnocylindria bacterium]
MRRLAAALLVGATLAGCGSVIPAGTPHDATAVFRPASMVADRETAAPGDVVELGFPDQMVRGIMFVLEREVGSTWVYRYLLISDANGGEPQWYPADRDDVAVEDVGIAGPGPDRVVIPDVAEPGSWRLCTGNAGENVCVRLEISG